MRPTAARLALALAVVVVVVVVAGCAGPWMAVDRTQAPRYAIPSGTRIALVQVTAPSGTADPECRDSMPPAAVQRAAAEALTRAFAPGGLALVDRTAGAAAIVRASPNGVERTGAVPAVDEPLVAWIYVRHWPCAARELQELDISVGVWTRDGADVDTQAIRGAISPRATDLDRIELVPDRPPPHHQTTHVSSDDERANDAPRPYLWRPGLESDVSITPSAELNGALLVTQAMDRYAAAFVPTRARYTARYDGSPGAKPGLDQLEAGDAAGARRTWEAAAARDPTDAAVQFDLAQLLVVGGDDRAALGHVDAALALRRSDKYADLRRQIIERLDEERPVTLPAPAPP